MKTLLHFSPLALFGLAYWWKADIYFATAVLMGALPVMLIIDYAMTRKLNGNLIAYSLLALILGAATLILHDPKFLKMKLTLIDGGLAIALFGSNWLGKQVLLKRMMGEALTLPETLWRKLNFVWAAFFACCALLNWYVAENFEEATWVKFKFICATVLPFIFIIAQTPFLLPHLSEKESEPSPANPNEPPSQS